MKEKTYGYIRVSSKDQNELRQIIAMKDFGIAPQNIFLDKQSGKDFVRPGYQRLIQKLKPDDTLVIKSIDRLGRNYNEILEQWRILTRQKQVAIIVLDMPLLNTKVNRDLTGTLIADIVLQLLSYVAESERKAIKIRQSEGITAAKANGVKFGRRPLVKPPNYPDIKAKWENGTLSGRQAAKLLGISHTTFRNWTLSNK